MAKAERNFLNHGLLLGAHSAVACADNRRDRPHVVWTFAWHSISAQYLMYEHIIAQYESF